jgi:hypothetical protein
MFDVTENNSRKNIFNLTEKVINFRKIRSVQTVMVSGYCF